MHISTANYNPLNHERDKVRELVPQYLRDGATNLISFMEEYYGYLNREGYASYELSHVIDEQDIDATSAKYLDAIQSEIASIVPNSTVVDRNTLYKRIVHYYRVKGTPESVDVFFQLMFNTLADVYYPGDNLLKLSAGTYDETKSSYTKDSGFLSGNDKIQDSDFWQDLSYVVTSSIPSSQWSNSFKRLVHPAGLKFFSKAIVQAAVTSRWDQSESYLTEEDRLIAFQPPRLRGTSSYNGFHSPKFQPGWLAAAIGGLVVSFADGHGTFAPRAKSFISFKLLISADNWQNQLNAKRYYNRGFWDDASELHQLTYLKKPISTLINEYQQEYIPNRLLSVKAPQPAIKIDTT